MSYYVEDLGITEFYSKNVDACVFSEYRYPKVITFLEEVNSKGEVLFYLIKINKAVF